MNDESKTNKKGIIYLTGSGPGDEKLLTVKAVEVLKSSDVVVYDYLATNVDLDKFAPQAEKIYVGKRGRKHFKEQGYINDLLVKLGKEGKKVVRLKGGDPFVFGRGGEEASALSEAGINYEVIPGITSGYAAAAYAGIPVTQRGLASTLVIVTGHEDPDKKDSGVDWKLLAKTTGTVVFLMGIKNLPKIVENLVKNGKDLKTPVALIRWGTTNRQQTLEGRIDDIVEKVRSSKFQPPAIIVIGKVAALREKLKWVEKRPLFGKNVVVTRSRGQASELTQALQELGANIIELPVIKVVEPDSYKKLDESIDRQVSDEYYDWLVFTSANGVTYFANRIKQKELDIRVFKGTKIAAVGSSTAAVLEKLGVRVDLVPKEYKAEGLIEAMPDTKGLKVLMPRAKVAREILPEELIKAGAQVDVVDAYQTIADPEGKKRINELEDKIDFVTFTSSSTVKNFISALGEKRDDILKTAKIAVIGPITAKTAEKEGLKVDAIADPHTIDGLMKAVVEVSEKIQN